MQRQKKDSLNVRFMTPEHLELRADYEIACSKKNVSLSEATRNLMDLFIEIVRIHNEVLSPNGRIPSFLRELSENQTFKELCKFHEVDPFERLMSLIALDCLHFESEGKGLDTFAVQIRQVCGNSVAHNIPKSLNARIDLVEQMNRELGEAEQIDLSFINAIAEGTVVPQYHHVILIGNILNLEISELFDLWALDKARQADLINKSATNGEMKGVSPHSKRGSEKKY